MVHQNPILYLLSSESPQVLGNKHQTLKMKSDLKSYQSATFCHLKSFFNLELQFHSLFANQSLYFQNLFIKQMAKINNWYVMRKNHDLFLRFDALQMTKRWDILFHFHRKRLLSFLFHHLFGQISFYFQIFKAWSFVTSCVKFLLLSFISFLY